VVESGAADAACADYDRVEVVRHVARGLFLTTEFTEGEHRGHGGDGGSRIEGTLRVDLRFRALC
jgi:hypothetical protein